MKAERDLQSRQHQTKFAAVCHAGWLAPSLLGAKPGGIQAHGRSSAVFQVSERADVDVVGLQEHQNAHTLTTGGGRAGGVLHLTSTPSGQAVRTYAVPPPQTWKAGRMTGRQAITAVSSDALVRLAALFCTPAALRTCSKAVAMPQTHVSQRCPRDRLGSHPSTMGYSRKGRGEWAWSDPPPPGDGQRCSRLLQHGDHRATSNRKRKKPT